MKLGKLGIGRGRLASTHSGFAGFAYIGEEIFAGIESIFLSEPFEYRIYLGFWKANTEEDGFVTAQNGERERGWVSGIHRE